MIVFIIDAIGQPISNGTAREGRWTVVYGRLRYSQRVECTSMAHRAFESCPLSLHHCDVR